MKKVWIYIKENKVATIAIVLLLVALAFIFWPMKTRKDTGINEGVVVIIDSLLKANQLLTIQQQQMKRAVDTVLMRVTERDAKIIEKYFYRDNKIRAVDNASDDVLQGLIDERYRP